MMRKDNKPATGQIWGSEGYCRGKVTEDRDKRKTATHNRRIPIEVSIGDDSMEPYCRSLARRPKENIKFQNLVQFLIWAKMKTGKPSDEIVDAVLSIAKKGLAISSSEDL